MNMALLAELHVGRCSSISAHAIIPGVPNVLQRPLSCARTLICSGNLPAAGRGASMPFSVAAAHLPAGNKCQKEHWQMVRGLAGFTSWHIMVGRLCSCSLTYSSVLREELA